MTKKSINQRGPGKISGFRNDDGRFGKANLKEGRSAVKRESDPAKGGGSSGSYKLAGSASVTTTTRATSKPSSARTTEPKLARPVAQRVDPREFAAELLVTDRIIMDHLAK
ncbi:hypothetical protein ELH80_33580 [Rhizobium ruizarguesonis]|jgi:hypothetical protein|uniref:Uncharacterized protein n=1 Tax=Rhizobium ruizarguesonis TaxID=2081791 RepID=A0AAE8Q771_9HYPH|nr:hypothetical protein [Rhizobium ruizarguesonis]MCB2406295.1 hypothetical protein [Rhizobium ruizarguesonis]NEI53242.1 hypothetical protein [Rhizobium ruizarguesonis]TAY70469.1 hypothetical protein ELH86_30845 [Rhizobium ruizarguesonis]TAZ24850.1 hypothetical protein ELH80_33580 [Rhizobium ruizarguesonis]TBA56352.1 hypothetical protein ELH58_32510 [Rhizobium ruizarguesonis]